MPQYLCKFVFCKKQTQNKIAINNSEEEIYTLKLGKSIQNSFKKFLRKK